MAHIIARVCACDEELREIARCERGRPATGKVRLGATAPPAAAAHHMHMHTHAAPHMHILTHARSACSIHNKMHMRKAPLSHFPRVYRKAAKGVVLFVCLFV